MSYAGQTRNMKSTAGGKSADPETEMLQDMLRTIDDKLEKFSLAKERDLAQLDKLEEETYQRMRTLHPSWLLAKKLPEVEQMIKDGKITVMPDGTFSLHFPGQTDQQPEIKQETPTNTRLKPLKVAIRKPKSHTTQRRRSSKLGYSLEATYLIGPVIRRSPPKSHFCPKGAPRAGLSNRGNQKPRNSEDGSQMPEDDWIEV